MKSKKHKKHKDHHKSGCEDSPFEQRPLKLVLKVGSSSSSNNLATAKKKKKSKKHKHGHHRSHHSHHHHRHHRRSSCSHHSKSSSSSQHHTSSEQPYVTPLSIKTHPIPNEINEVLPSKSPPPPRLVSTGGKTGSKSQFIQFLGHLLKLLQKRDMHDFFAWPVTDMIAPGYSSIISHPMDFETMKKKIAQGLYETLDSFRSDVKLICDNAMVYNMPETIYYKAARKLWHYARCKIFNKNILPELAKPYPDLSPGQLGYDMEESPIMEIDSSIQTVPGIENSQQDSCTDPLKLPDKEMNDFSEIELIDDEELTAEQILAHVKKSAKIAADRLTLERPEGSHLSFLRQKNDGTTTLGIIGSQGKEKTVTLGSLVGQLSDGISCLPPYKEPEANRVKMIDSVTITPFSSFLPSMDSTFATLSKEETQLLTSTYGEDEIGLHYTQSLLSFANDNDYVMNMVGSLLEVLTHGQHGKTMHKLKDLQKEKEREKEKEKEKAKEKEREREKEREKEKEREREKEKKKEEEKEKDQEKDGDKESEKEKEKDGDKEKDKKKDDEIDKARNKEQTKDNTDMDIEMIAIDTSSDDIQPQLDKSSQLINELQSINHQRLASSTQPIPPSDDEMKLANLLCDKLTTFISSHTTPADISDPRAIRKALGIQIKSENH